MMRNPLFVLDDIPLDPKAVVSDRVQFVSGTARRISPGRQSPLLFSAYHATFDKTGCYLRLEIRDYKGGMSHYGTFDSHGNLIRMAYRNRNEIEESAHEFFYDELHLLREKRLVAAGQVRHRFMTERSGDGALLGMVCMDESGKVLRRDQYHYEAGRLVLLSLGHIGEWRFEYDDMGRLAVKTANLASQNFEGETYRFHYSANALLHKMERVGQDVAEMRYEFFNDS